MISVKKKRVLFYSESAIGVDLEPLTLVSGGEKMLVCRYNDPDYSKGFTFLPGQEGRVVINGSTTFYTIDVRSKSVKKIKLIPKMHVYGLGVINKEKRIFFYGTEKEGSRYYADIFSMDLSGRSLRNLTRNIGGGTQLSTP